MTVGDLGTRLGRRAIIRELKQARFTSGCRPRLKNARA